MHARVQPGAGGDASDVHQAVEEIERRFLDVIHRHSPRKNIHVHVIASRVRLEMKSAFSDVKDRIKVRRKNYHISKIIILFFMYTKNNEKMVIK